MPAERQLGIGPGNVVENIMPVSTRLATFLPRAISLVKTEPPQSEVGVVGECDRLVFVLNAEEQRHWAKELLSESWIVRLDVGQDGRGHIRSRTIDTLSAHDQLAPWETAPSTFSIDPIRACSEDKGPSVVFSSKGSPRLESRKRA